MTPAGPRTRLLHTARKTGRVLDVMTDDTTPTDDGSDSEATPSDRATANPTTRYVDGAVIVDDRRHEFEGDVQFGAEGSDVEAAGETEGEAMTGSLSVGDTDAEIGATVSATGPDAATTTTTVAIEYPESASGVGNWVLGFHGEASTEEDSITIWDTVASGYMNAGWKHTIEVTGTLEWFNCDPAMTHQILTGEEGDD